MLLLLMTARILPVPCLAQSASKAAQAKIYLGFDRNDYPGDNLLSELHRTFAFTSYWLNNPPGAHANSWHGKRERLQRAGFGFLLLYNGRDYAHLKNLLVHHQVIVPVTDGRLELGPWQAVFYCEFDGRRSKRLIIKVLGE